MRRLERGGDRGVEALEVTGGDDATVVLSEGDERVGFGEGGGEGFFDEDVEACLEKPGGHLRVRDRGDGDNGGMEAEVGGEEVVHGAESGDVVAGGDVVADHRVGVDGGGEFDERRRGRGRVRRPGSVWGRGWVAGADGRRVW